MILQEILSKKQVYLGSHPSSSVWCALFHQTLDDWMGPKVHLFYRVIITVLFIQYKTMYFIKLHSKSIWKAWLML